MQKSIQMSCLLVMTVGTALFLVSYCTVHWISPQLLANSTVLDPRQGLWLMCDYNNTCQLITPVTAVLRSVQVIETAAVVTILVTYVATFAGLARHSLRSVRIQAILNFITGSLIWIGIFIYRGQYSVKEYDNAGFSLFFGVVGGTIFLVTCLLNVMDYNRIIHEKEDR